MKIEIKNEIRKMTRIAGSHFGIIRHLITAKHPDIDFAEYKNYTLSLLDKKLKNVESKIKASVRYQ